MLGKQNTANPEIRRAMKEAKISQWQIAEAMGVHFNTIGTRLRTEMSEQSKAEFLKVIRTLAKAQ